MALILFLGPTRFLLQAFVENIGLYLNAFVSRTFHIYAYEPTDWVGTWTLFYWGWWMSWSPFVGMFIARISRGRTIRSEEHTSELQSLMRTSYAVFCLKKKKK